MSQGRGPYGALPGTSSVDAPVDPLAGPPVGPVERARDWVRHHVPLTAVAAALVVALVVVAAVGGFRERSTIGQPLQAGEVVDVGRFDIRVDRVELADTSPGTTSPPEADDPVFFRIWSTVTNTTDSSIGLSLLSHVDCVVPGGRDQDDTRSSRSGDWDVANLDPGVSTTVYTERTWKAGSFTAASPATLRVVVLPDVPATGFISSGQDDPPKVGSIAIGWVDVPVADVRVQPEAGS